MFTYLISPNNNTNSHLFISITIKDDVITGYIQKFSYLSFSLQNMPILGNLLRKVNSQIRFLYCLDDYSKNENIQFIHPEDRMHAKQHSSDKDEDEVMHTHLKHQRKITPDILKKFLGMLEKCDEVHRISGETIINRSIKKDIVHKFEKHFARNHRLTTGNHPQYQNQQQSLHSTTIAEHERCLSNDKYIACTPDNPLSPNYNPNKQVITAKEENNSINKDAFYLGATLGAFALGFFAMRCNSKRNVSKHKHKPPFATQHSTVSSSSASHYRRR